MSLKLADSIETLDCKDCLLWSYYDYDSRLQHVVPESEVNTKKIRNPKPHPKRPFSECWERFIIRSILKVKDCEAYKSLEGVNVRVTEGEDRKATRRNS